MRGHRVRVFALAESIVRGVELIESDSTPAFSPGETATADAGPFIGIFSTLERWCSEGHLDVLHLHLNDPPALLLADRLARRFPAVRVISTLHLAAVFPETTRVVRALLTQGTPITFVAPSRYAAASYLANGLEVIPNGIDVAAIPFAATAPDDGRLAWAGRRTPEKGLAAAIELSRLANRPLSIAGPPGEPIVLPPFVTDHGRLPRSEVPRLFGNAAAVLVTSTIAEAHPLVALEALAAGTPVLAFDTGGLREIVTPGQTGWLVPPGDLTAAAEVLEHIGTIDRARCRAEAERRFGQDAMLDAYTALYARR